MLLNVVQSRNFFWLKSFPNRIYLNIFHSYSTTNENPKTDESSFNTDNSTPKKLHIPVMLNEVISSLVTSKTEPQSYCDLTFGAGGHTEAILNSNPNCKVYALDRDPEANKIAFNLKENYHDRLIPIIGRFSHLEKLFRDNNVQVNSLDGALIDCGCSSIQFDNPDRGFSVSKNGLLDMRMGYKNETDTITAADVVNKLDEISLGKIIWRYGEEKYYKKIAHAIIYFRNSYGNIATTKQLADIITTVIKESRFDSLDRHTHVATKTFQALRIFVNNELNELYNGINIVYKYLKPGGRLAVITFHSLEDRIVKTHFNSSVYDKNQLELKVNINKTTSTKKELKQLQESINQLNVEKQKQEIEERLKKLWSSYVKLQIPNKEEIEENPRSRSAKLRIAIKN